MDQLIFALSPSWRKDDGRYSAKTLSEIYRKRFYEKLLTFQLMMPVVVKRQLSSHQRCWKCRKQQPLTNKMDMSPTEVASTLDGLNDAGDMLNGEG